MTLSLTDYLLVAAVFASASFIQGFSGFGFGIFSMAVLPFVIEFKFGVLVCTLVGVAALGATAWELRRRLAWRAAAVFLPGLVVSNVVGAECFVRAATALLVGLLAVVVLFTGLRGMFQRESVCEPSPHEARRPGVIQPGWFWGTVLGLVAGFLGSVINMPGPPVIVYAYAVAAPGPARAFLVVIFIVNLVVKITAFAVRGLWTWPVLAVTAIMLPVAALGSALGGELHNRLPKARLVRVAHLILLALGLLLLWKALEGPHRPF